MPSSTENVVVTLRWWAFFAARLWICTLLIAVALMALDDIQHYLASPHPDTTLLIYPIPLLSIALVALAQGYETFLSTIVAGGLVLLLSTGRGPHDPLLLVHTAIFLVNVALVGTVTSVIKTSVKKSWDRSHPPQQKPITTDGPEFLPSRN